MTAIRLAFSGYLLVGVFAVLFPTIMPTVIDGFGLSLAAAGLLYPVKAVGSLAGVTSGGMVSDWLGRRVTMASSSALLVVGLVVAAKAEQWSLFLCGFFLAGLAQGALTVSVNAVTAESAGVKSARALNHLHGTYSIGAALSPLVLGWLLMGGGKWQPVLLVLAGIWMAFAGGAVFCKYPPIVAQRGKRGSLALLLRHPVLLLAGVIAFTYNGLAWSLIGWINTYLQQEAKLPPFLATGMITLFYAALAGGRFICASLSTRFGSGKVLLTCAVGAIFVYPMVLAKPWPVLTVAGVLLSGLFLSGLYPTALSCATRIAPNQVGAVSGALATAMTLGTMLPPWWTGLIAQQVGLQGALALNYAFALACAWAAFRLNKMAHEHTLPANELKPIA